MNINPEDHQSRDHHGEETAAELLADCMDLIEQATGHLTSDHIENRLQQILNPAPQPGPSHGAPRTPAPAQQDTEEAGTQDRDTRAELLGDGGNGSATQPASRHRQTCRVSEAPPPPGADAAPGTPPQADAAALLHQGADNRQPWTNLRRRLLALERQLSAEQQSVEQEADPALSRPGFWRALTPHEREAFAASAEPVAFGGGHRLWREHDLASHVLVIQQGWVRVSVTHQGQARVLAIRGPGDIVGERAMLLLRQRSATVVALDTVLALRMSARRFGEFLARHSRVVNVVEAELRQRLVEEPHLTADPAIPAPPSAPARAAGAASQMSSIVFADIVGFSAERTDAQRRRSRADMYQMLCRAMDQAQLPWEACYREDRGDGALIIVPPQFAPSAVLEGITVHLRQALHHHNLTPTDGPRLRLRVAVHVGPVILDDTGAAGASIVYTARMMELAELRSQMAHTDTDLGFITSSFVFDNVIADRTGSRLDPRDFAPARARSKGTDVTGWIHTAEPAARPALPPTAPPRRRTRRRPVPEPHPLSVMETELIELITRGLTDRQIAQHLVVNEQDIKDRLRQIRSKLAAGTPATDAADAPLSANALTAAYLDDRLAST
ncbi:cyclic nucleotide-binding domain-containing protein [Actinomadura rupiterrae]|uniref:cyclic nucleotide-binding domain-containing protein n=1 Tax=Actinomadura rupiterrae TaxID=559627 RepID=UPI0020A4FD28|nr:cyclic nucleotide-binding domain-containing protein [Actinomadura rupiterrae]MCP2343158.1 CRP-like cAMP-binding protein/DNA-binding CsgD family transcriptional regulator [Actinomadura rupiterrae]